MDDYRPFRRDRSHHLDLRARGGLAAGVRRGQGALISHAKTLAVALAPQGIRVNAGAPGSIDFPEGAWDRVKHKANL